MKIVLLAFSCLSSLVISIGVSAQSISISDSVIGKQNPRFDSINREVLSSFFFNTLKYDHHIKNISLLPNPSKQNISIDFSDKVQESENDRYYYQATYETLSIPGLFVTNVIGQRCFGSCSINLYKPQDYDISRYLFAIVGFSFEFLNGDRHIDQIGLIENNGVLQAYFNDYNDDDPFKVNVRYTYIPRQYIRLQGNSGSISSYSGDGIVPAGRFIINGFKFDFKRVNGGDHDHHIKNFGIIRLPDKNIRVVYTDKHFDRPYSWQVQWSILN